jgi:hypothetical protein
MQVDRRNDQADQYRHYQKAPTRAERGQDWEKVKFPRYFSILIALCLIHDGQVSVPFSGQVVRRYLAGAAPKGQISAQLY